MSRMEEIMKLKIKSVKNFSTEKILEVYGGILELNNVFIENDEIYTENPNLYELATCCNKNIMFCLPDGECYDIPTLLIVDDYL